MAVTIHCDIVSAEKHIFSGLVEMIIAAGTEGDLGIAHGHAPLLAGLKPGPVRVITQKGQEQVFYVSGGYVEVQPDGATILADTVVRAEDVDEAAAQKARDEAQANINNKGAELDYAAAAAQLAEAAAQLRALQAVRKSLGK